MTLVEIIDQITAIGNANKAIKTTYFGSNADLFAIGDVDYPLFSFELIDMPLDDKKESFNFEMFVVDMMRQDRSNEVDALSDMIAISNDIVAALSNNNNDFQIVKQITRERIQDETPDVVCGVRMKITLYQPYDANRCQIPNF